MDLEAFGALRYILFVHMNQINIHIFQKKIDNTENTDVIVKFSVSVR